MPPKRKRGSSAKKSTRKKLENMTTEEFLDHARNKTNSKLEKSVSKEHRGDDLDLVFKTIRALINTNEEIWQRCLGSEHVVDAESHDLLFKRFAYTKIEVSTTTSSSSKTLAFKAIPEYTSKAFGMPPNLPKHLSSIITPPLAADEIFIDYEKYLETASLLNEETLLHFVSILKAHLEDLQVFLGEIDTWLMQPQFCVNFITECFDISATELPESPKFGAIPWRTISGQKTYLTTCIHCNYHRYYDDLRQYNCTKKCRSPEGHSYFHPKYVLLKHSRNSTKQG